MKITFPILLMLHLSFSTNISHTSNLNSAGVVYSNNDTFNIDCVPSKSDYVIKRKDTIIDYSKYHGHLIRSFDALNRVREKFITNLYESNSNKIFSSLELYDSVGHLVYENRVQKSITWHCYRYVYDKQGHLVLKTGYSSGEMGVKISYIYVGNKLVKQIIERPGSKTEKTY